MLKATTAFEEKKEKIWDVDTYAEREEKRYKVNQKIKTMRKGLTASSYENKNLLLEELP